MAASVPPEKKSAPSSTPPTGTVNADNQSVNNTIASPSEDLGIDRQHAPHLTDSRRVQMLQRVIGNQAVQRLLTESRPVIQRETTAALPDPTVLNPKLDNVLAAYTAEYGVYGKQRRAMNQLRTDLEVADEPSVEQQLVTTAVTAGLGFAAGYIGGKIATKALEYATAAITAPAASAAASAASTATATAAAAPAPGLGSKIADLLKDKAKSKATEAASKWMDTKAKSSVKFNFINSQMDAIDEQQQSTVETFNENKAQFLRSPNGVAEAESLLRAVHENQETAFQQQYAQSSAAWATLQRGWFSSVGDRGTLVLTVTAADAGADFTIVSARLEGLNDRIRENLKGLSQVRLSQLNIPVRMEGQSFSWFRASAASDNVVITFPPDSVNHGIPQFEPTGTTAEFIVARAMARYGATEEFRRAYDRSAGLRGYSLRIKQEIGNLRLNQIGDIAGS